MLRLVLFLAVVVAVATGFSWLADRPGDIVVKWQGYHIETNVFIATIGLVTLILTALVGWSLLRHLWESPASVGRYFQRRRQSHGLDALSSGMIAIGAGDRETAVRYAIQARKALPNEPLTHLLRAQAAQLAGDKATSRRIFEAMLGSPDTEQLGLRGLFLEAVREGEEEAALQFAERALKLNPKLGWSSTSLFELQCKRGDWKGALETLAIAKRNGHVEKASADRRRAVLLTAQAQAAEETDTESALNLALEAHGLAPDLIPAAEIAGRMLASRGNTPRAAKIIQKTWKTSPHPDLAVVYAYARLGDSPSDRLERVTKLSALNPHTIESPIAVATAAIEAKDFGMARHVLKPLLEGKLTQRVCTLMARIEGEEFGNKGRVREWLARAVNAPRDPAWTADGIVSEHWAPVSPVSGALDAFQWRVPVESLDANSEQILANKLEELVALGAPSEILAASEETERDAEIIEAKSSKVQNKVAPDEEENNDEELRVKAERFEEALKADEEQLSHRGVEEVTSSQPEKHEFEERKDKDHDRRREPVRESARKDLNTGTEADLIKTRKAVSSSRKSKQQSGTSATTKVEGGTDASAEKSPQKYQKTKGKGRQQKQKSKPHGKGQAQVETGDKLKEPEIFVSPHAPDDPGPDAVFEIDERRPTANPYRRRTPT